MPEPIRVAGRNVDLSQRVVQTSTVGASPAAGAETVIGTLAALPDIVSSAGVFLTGWAAFTVGTSGVSATLRIRQTNVSGTVICSTGATTVAAGNLWETGVQGLDASPTLPGQVYVLTLLIGSGAATSTVSALQILALVI